MTRPISHTREFYVLRSLQGSEELFESTETVVLDENSGAPFTTEQHVLHVAMCGHTVTDPSQVTACSLCGNQVCPACQVRCTRCLRVLCNAHGRWLGGKLYCTRCRVIAFSQITTVRGVPAALRAVHKLLSKEL